METHPLVPSNIVKPHLNYDGESYRQLSERESQQILATHGTTVATAAKLLLEGAFPYKDRLFGLGAATSELGKEFYTIPNPKNPKFNVDALEGDFDYNNFAGIDPMLAAIEYADDAEEGGVVIAFSGKLALQNTVIYTDSDYHARAQSAYGIELIFPEAPSIQEIKALYPIDEKSEHNLNQRLTGFKSAA